MFYPSSLPPCPQIQGPQAGDPPPSPAPVLLLAAVLLTLIAAAMLSLPQVAENHLRSTHGDSGRQLRRVRYRSPWRRPW